MTDHEDKVSKVQLKIFEYPIASAEKDLNTALERSGIGPDAVVQMHVETGPTSTRFYLFYARGYRDVNPFDEL